MSALLMKQKNSVSNSILRDLKYDDRRNHYMIRSDHSLIKSVMLEFDGKVDPDIIWKSLEFQMKFYLAHMTTDWVAASIWEDQLCCVISLYPVNGAA